MKNKFALLCNSFNAITVPALRRATFNTRHYHVPGHLLQRDIPHYNVTHQVEKLFALQSYTSKEKTL